LQKNLEGNKKIQREKLKHQKVTVEEVGAYLGINADDIRKIFSKDH